MIDPATESPHGHWAEVGVPTTLLERAVATMSGADAPNPVIFEAVGVPGVLQSLIEEAPPRSRIVVVGVCMHTDRIEPFMAVTKEVELVFSFAYTPAEFAATLERLRRRGARGRPADHRRGRPRRRARAPSTGLRTPGRHGKIVVHP